MLVQMLFRREKWLRRRGAKPSFAGNGLLERMRSTTFAILGVTTAMCLGLVAIVAQQGLPVLPGLPLPGVSAERGQVHEARAIAVPRTSPGLSDATEGPAAEAASGRSDRARPERSDVSGLTESRQLETAQAPVPAEPAASSEEVPVAPAPVAPPSTQAPAVAAAPQSVSPAPAEGGASGGKGTAVVDSSEGDDEAPPPPTPPAQAQSDADAEAEEAAGSPPSQAEIDADRGRGAGRGQGNRRFGR